MDHANIYHKNSGIAVLISDKYVRQKVLIEINRDFFIAIQRDGVNPPVRYHNLNLYIPNNMASKTYEPETNRHGRSSQSHNYSGKFLIHTSY